MTLEAKMKAMLLRIAWPRRGSADERKTIEEFSEEIRDTFKQWELDNSYDPTPVNDGRKWPQANNE